MHVSLLAAPWYEGKPTEALSQACLILADNVWSDAAVSFYAERAARLRRGKGAPKGIQSELNRVIAQRFEAAGWLGAEGRFAKDRTWVRVTFRHQMSLGSDFLDAARLCAKESYEQTAILAAQSSFLRLISPNDASALVSFEKLTIALADLQGVLSTPLFIGALSPQSAVPPDIAAELRRERPRDVTTPVHGPGPTSQGGA